MQSSVIYNVLQHHTLHSHFFRTTVPWQTILSRLHCNVSTLQHHSTMCYVADIDIWKSVINTLDKYSQQFSTVRVTCTLSNFLPYHTRDKHSQQLSTVPYQLPCFSSHAFREVWVHRRRRLRTVSMTLQSRREEPHSALIHSV